LGNQFWILFAGNLDQIESIEKNRLGSLTERLDFQVSKPNYSEDDDAYRGGL
jgi:hypothetical protein